MRGERLDWYPKAVRMLRKMPTLGKYEAGYPKGAVIHFTAGRDGGERAILTGIEENCAFLCIQKDGTVYQAHPISEWGSHAGASHWPLLEHGRVSDELIGIEICCAGKVDRYPDGRYRTWYGSFLEVDDVRYTEGLYNQAQGFWERFTASQELSMLSLLVWLKSQAPDTFDYRNVVGHDEVCLPKGRKNDPGGSLSLSMPELRERLLSLKEV